MAKARIGPDGALYQHVGAEIRRLRLLNDLKQDQLAFRVGMSRASIANLEAGKQAIPLHHLVALARTLDTGIDALLPPGNSKRGQLPIASTAPESVLSFMRELAREP